MHRAGLRPLHGLLTRGVIHGERQGPDRLLQPEQPAGERELEQRQQPERALCRSWRGEDLCAGKRFKPSAKHPAGFGKLRLNLKGFGFVG